MWYSWKAELNIDKNEVRLCGENRVFKIKILAVRVGSGINRCESIYEDRFFVEDINFEVIMEDYNNKGMELIEYGNANGNNVQYP